LRAFGDSEQGERGPKGEKCDPGQQGLQGIPGGEGREWRQCDSGTVDVSRHFLKLQMQLTQLKRAMMCKYYLTAIMGP
jgi:hypothetical protein